MRRVLTLRIVTMGKLVDLSGRRFGRLRVVGYAGLDGGKNAAWDCVCDCGEKITVRGYRLRSGETASCGCLRIDVESRPSIVRGDSTVGKTADDRSLYATWTSLRSRCLSPSDRNYAGYGGRGITVCERWGSFENFVADMGKRPFRGAQIDRINNDGPYSPENCRWTTRQGNSRNRRSARFIETPKGRMLICEAAAVFGLKQVTIQGRLLRGWPEDRVCEPLQRQGKKSEE